MASHAVLTPRARPAAPRLRQADPMYAASSNEADRTMDPAGPLTRPGLNALSPITPAADQATPVPTHGGGRLFSRGASADGVVLQRAKTKNQAKTSAYPAFRTHVLTKGRKLAHKRAQTAYGAFQPQGKTSQQGPHVGSHVSNQVAYERVLFDINAETDKKKKAQLLSRLSGTRLAPTPRQLLSLQKRVFSKKDWDKFKPRAKRFHARNKRLFRQFTDTAAPLAKRQRAFGQYIEAHPLQTYDQGQVVPHAHIVGKGENRTTALSQAEGITKGTVDVAASLDPHANQFFSKTLHPKINKRQRQLARRTVEDDAALSDESESEVDSDDEFD